ncbi:MULTISPECIES: tRNA preQ1(34) S-adenosylmethionine ribosyltransferase-isomerase QueA [Psychrobacter]|uniref:S-adenosylmethionine:tRNA ribosyltransferase-isomerase n=1 Tax=Psychrobacter pacificensis TaxID=112002 RepID=A0A1G6ZP45_9GAMM|nr:MULTISPECIES: tRNA preQ1(34) S-adenosylmethionine ribosyltransferase-isomerase QueA [Psychrobacter]AOY42446.1 S-adenosylmethionine:tRNA ribosyltransferase-isomerase [Psychrobacter sp. AntiMn-1]GLR28758.1 S-adenosylmethionine:tRNA ribosyltransferase-isomerase [Psychrobacter pacificensis]SDE04320.1 S-adenosylmethionine:tRNA ribosyltransferase-isomerase [Psychrobacter pacificensis]HBD02773.1 tRNA preQ1(34) S-adenosylmethionine ribosyltransferase-isomerase QueA [Psychrobacter sp.]
MTDSHIDSTDTDAPTDTDKKNDVLDYLSVEDYDYELPDSLIARYPLAQRSASKLLYLPARTQINDTRVEDRLFSELPHLLEAGDLIVFNDTKVMKARLFGQKDTGGKLEVLIERLVDISDLDEVPLHLKDTNDEAVNQEHIALCHVKASKALKLGQRLQLADGHMSATMIGRQDNLFILAFDAPILPHLELYGELPIPPYFERHADDTDNTRYQTVFHDPAKLASVAAPTASLHFDESVLSKLDEKGINTAFVTLHVGAGTFAPVKTDNLLNHTMHSEYAHLPQTTANLINQTHANGKKVIAIGTTVTRVLETAYQKTAIDGQALSSWSGDTDIFIYPGFKFGVIDRLLTNFHLPKSTLLMLVSAFAGKASIEHAYQHAIEKQYRFFSYGDAMLLDKKAQ